MTQRQTPPAHLIRDQIARDRRRRRALWTTVGAAVVLLVASLIGWMVSQSQRDSNASTPATATADGGGLVAAGAGPATVDVYLDFLCPNCRDLEAAAGSTMEQLAANGKITLVWHPLGYLDRYSTTGYSTRSAASSGCAADGGRLKAYGDALFANQPAEGGAGLSDDDLVRIGASVGLTDPAFGDCVRSGKYHGWVGHVNDLSAERGVQGTPTVFVNGKEVAADAAAITTAVG